MVGVGLGQLSAAAVSCSKTIVDLIGPAVEAVRLAFRTGAAVGRYSSNSQQTDVSEEGHWNMTIDGVAEEIEAELRVLQDQMVWLSRLFNTLLAQMQVVKKICYETLLLNDCSGLLGWQPDSKSKHDDNTLADKL